ncbi:MAG: hypothetical protein M3N45_12805 [Actinomycetota bacterium]|nr:hypothetical protein [Actinomycetota bacterium]
MPEKPWTVSLIPYPLPPLWRHERVVEAGYLPPVITTNQDQTLQRAVFAGEGARRGAHDPRGVVMPLRGAGDTRR